MALAPLLALLLAFLPAFAWAGDFQLSGSVDKSTLDLGDTLEYTLTLTVNGSLDFQPQIDKPDFPAGFQAGEPSQSQSFNWINGASTQVYTWTWALEADQPGTYTLGPYHAAANDALNGRIDRRTQPITVTVRHPQGLGYPLPGAAQPQAQSASQPEPPPDEGELHGIKPDRGIPWAELGEALGGLLAVLALIAWLAQRNPPKVVEEPLPSDPVRAALQRLDQARTAFKTVPDGRLYAGRVGEALRLYLRSRLDLRPGLTLGEAFQALRARAPQVLARGRSLRQSLELPLYAGSELGEEGQLALDNGARSLIESLEQARKLNPEEQALSKQLDRLAALWGEGQAKSAWMGMRSAVGAHLRKSLGLGPGALPKADLLRALRPLDAPELARALEALFVEAPPRGAEPKALATRLLALAQALDSVQLDPFDPSADRAGDDSSRQGEA